MRDSNFNSDEEERVFFFIFLFDIHGLHTCLPFFQSLFRFCMKLVLESRHLAYQIAYKIERKGHSLCRVLPAHSRNRFTVKQANVNELQNENLSSIYVDDGALRFVYRRVQFCFSLMVQYNVLSDAHKKADAIIIF